MHFDAFVRDVEQNGWPVHGAEVYQQGRLAACWGDTEHRYPIYSATKTITSLAVGMALDDGRLALEDCVLRHLPPKVVQAMAPQQREAYRSITLRRLLTMSVSGYPFRPEGESWLQGVLAVPLPQPENAAFDYSNVSAYLAGVAAACAVGEPLDAYLNRRLFAPLGIAEPVCGHCPDGYFYGASQMELSVNELSRIGLLLAGGGVWQGRRIVSEGYVRAATSVQQMNREGGYGYFIWKYRDGFSINGKWGQKCFVLPNGLMITYLSDMPTGSERIKGSLERHILGIG